MHLTARREASCARLLPERALQQATATEQATHHRPLGDAGRFRDFGIAEPLHVGKLDSGAELRWQLVDRALDGVGAKSVQDGVFYISDAIAIAAQLVIEEEFLSVLQRAFLR